MKRIFLLAWLLPCVAFGASVPFTAFNPNQFEAQPTGGPGPYVAVKNGVALTNVYMPEEVAFTFAYFDATNGLHSSGIPTNAIGSSGVWTNSAGTVTLSDGQTATNNVTVVVSGPASSTAYSFDTSVAHTNDTLYAFKHLGTNLMTLGSRGVNIFGFSDQTPDIISAYRNGVEIMELTKNGEIDIYGPSAGRGQFGVLVPGTGTALSILSGFLGGAWTQATIGAPSQWSPPLTLSGNAWDTDDALSRALNGLVVIKPVSGASPSAILSINMGVSGFESEVFTLNSNSGYTGAGNLFLSDDGTYKAAGTGDVTGPASATAGHVAIFADGTGKVIADSGLATVTNLVTVHQTLTYAATTDVDFDLSGLRTLSLTGNITFTTSHKAAGKTVTVRLLADGSSRTLTFPAWVFVGAPAPGSIAANKTAIFTATCFGAADTDIVAAYSEQP